MNLQLIDKEKITVDIGDIILFNDGHIEMVIEMKDGICTVDLQDGLVDDIYKYAFIEDFREHLEKSCYFERIISNKKLVLKEVE